MSIPCQNCKQSAATVHVTDIVPPNGEKRERHLCEACAEEEGITMKQHEPINTILAKFVQQKAGTSIKDTAKLTCSHCGVSFREFRAQGQLGCPHDYQAFGKYLDSIVERAQGGATQHVGKVPSRLGPVSEREPDLRKLQRLLSDAVESEDYERAAGLRDQIKVLRSHGD